MPSPQPMGPAPPMPPDPPMPPLPPLPGGLLPSLQATKNVVSESTKKSRIGRIGPGHNHIAPDLPSHVCANPLLQRRGGEIGERGELLLDRGGDGPIVGGWGTC